MDAAIFTKTPDGHDEIQHRTRRLHPRLRSLLVVVDGKQSVKDLLKVLAPAGVAQEHFTQLHDMGLIEPLVGAVPSAAAAPSTATAPEARPADAAPAVGTSELPVQTDVPKDEGSKMMDLYRIVNETITAHFGLRGFSYQMALEKAVSLEDYVHLCNEILRALEKAKGNPIASQFKNRVKPYFV